VLGRDLVKKIFPFQLINKQGEMELRSKDFSYYIEQTEPLVLKKFPDDASILQLESKGKRTELTNHHSLNLALIFHPDKVQEKDRSKAEAIFHQLIYPAIRRCFKIEEAAESFDAMIDELFPIPETPEVSVPRITMKSSFTDIFKELTSQKAEQAVLLRHDKKLTYNYQSELEKKRRLFALLKAKAETPYQLFQIIRFQLKNYEAKGPSEYGNPFSSLMFQTAVTTGSPEALFLMARHICLGHYGSDDAPLLWALDALRYLETHHDHFKDNWDVHGMWKALRAEWETKKILPACKQIPQKDTKKYAPFFDRFRKAILAIQDVKVVSFPVLPCLQDLIPLTKMSQDRRLDGNFLATDLFAIQPPSPVEAAAATAAAQMGRERSSSVAKDEPEAQPAADVLAVQACAEETTVFAAAPPDPDMSKRPEAFGFPSLSGLWGLFSFLSSVKVPATISADAVECDNEVDDDYHLVSVVPVKQVSASAASGLS
jgi:hypothetical protein